MVEEKFLEGGGVEDMLGGGMEKFILGEGYGNREKILVVRGLGRVVVWRNRKK